MIKKLLRIVFLCALFSQFFTKASAQYAIGGTAGNTLVKSVYWLTWDSGAAGSTMISHPADYSAFNITNGTYVWQFSPTVRITAILSNEVSNTNNMQTYTPGGYSGDGLNFMYSGNNLPAPNSRGVANSGLMIVQGQVTFNMDIKVAILINGVYTNVNYPGMVIGDAESISSTNEYISGNTPSPIAWQLLNKRATGATGDDHYLLQLSNSGSSFKLFVDQPPGNLGRQAVMFAHGASNLTNLSMQGEGNTAMAIGFVLPFDLGDAPLSYGITGNYIDSFVITDTFPGDGTYSVINFATTPLVPVANVYIGSNNVDPDGQPVTTIAANNDDTTGVNDENTINPNTLPDVKVNQSGDVVLTVPATNNKATPATLYGWLDFNGDGVFTSDEGVSVTVPANTSNQNFTLTFPNATFKNKIVAGPLYLRMRITTTSLIDDITTTADDRSISFAADGETEDYKLKNILGISISGSIFDDGNGGLDGSIAGTAIQLVAGHQLYAYLVSNNVIVAQTAIAADGTYSFNTVNNGSYTVAISTNNVAIGGTLAAVSANLPTGFVPSGASYGVNNAFSSGVQSGAPNLQLPASTPGTSLDITGLNFSINQRPVATNKTASTNPGQAVAINATTGDTDADGTINVTSILLTDPADLTEKTTVTIPNQGTYTVNTTNGVVTFTPLATFSGGATPIAYTIKDNFGTESPTALIKVSVKPAGVADAVTTPIATPIVINVKANDGPSATGTTVIATNGSHGVTTVDASGNVTYTPVASFIGTDTFTYTLNTSDGTVSDPILVTVTVNPAGVNDTATTLVNNPVTINVKANDGPSAVGATVTPTFGAHGTTSVDGSGNVIYTPVANYTGTDTFTYTLTAPNGFVSAPITVTVTVNPQIATLSLTKAATNTVANAGDVIIYDLVLTNTGNVALTNVTVTDAGADAGSLTPSTFTTFSVGAIVHIAAKHTVTAADVTAGRYSNQASVTAFDPGGNPVNLPGSDDPNTPTPNDPTVSVISPPGAVSLTKTGVFSGNTVTFSFAIKNTGPVTLTNITLTDAKLNLTNAAVTNVPAGGLTAGSTITTTIPYTLTQADKDAGTVSNNATVNSKDPSGNVVSAAGSVVVTVAKSPVAKNDTSAVAFNQPVKISVINNDTPDNTSFDVASVQVISAPSHGTATANSDGTVTYTPTNNYSGPDSFTYKVADSYGYFSNVATVILNVATPSPSMTLTKTATSTAAKAGDIINYAFVLKNTGNAALTNVVITDAGVDAGSLSQSTISSLPVGVTVTTITGKHTVTAADVAAGSYSNQASVTAKDPNNNTVTTVSDDPTTPALNDPTVSIIAPPGVISLTKTGVFSGNSITFTFTIKNVGPVTLNTITLTDALLGLSSAAVTVPAGGLTVGSTVTYSASYTLNQADKDAGSVTNNATVSSKDPSGNIITAPATVVVTVAKSPVANNDASTVNFNQSAQISVLSNDTPDNTSFNLSSVQIVSAPTHGTATPNSDGTVTYTPTTNYSGTDSFTYRVQDSYGYYTNVATVTITVVAPTPSMSLTKVATNTVANAGDVINYTIVVKNTGNVALTNIVITDAGADAGSIAPVPPASLAVGASSVFTAKHTVTAADVIARSYSNQAGVTATDPTGNPVSTPKSDDPTTPTPNDPTVSTIVTTPVAVNDVAQVPFNQPVIIAVLNNDDPKGSTFNVSSLQIVTAPAHGTTTINADGTITYTPNNNYVGLDSFTYTVKDAFGTTSNVATVTLSVSTFTATLSLTKVALNGASNPGDVINYTIAVKNTGNATLTNVIITDLGADPGSVTPSTIASLAPGVSVTNITAKHTVTAADVAAGSFSNQATVTATDPSGNPVPTTKSDDPNTPTVNDPTTTPIIPLGAISLTKAGVFSGNIITYTFTIKNTGPVTLKGVTLTDNKIGLSAIAVPIPSVGLTAGSTVTYTATYTLTQSDKDVGTVLNNASVSSTDPSGNTITNNASVTVNVPVSPVANADVATTGVGLPVTIPILTNDNPGNSTFNLATVQIVTPPSHGTVVPNSNGTVTYTPASGYSGTDAFTYKVQDAYGYSTNIAAVTVTVVPPGTVSLTKTGVVSGNTVIYTFTVKNTGLVTLTGITITDTKLGLTNAVVSIPSGGLTAGSTATYTSTYTLTQADRDAASVVNSASVSSKDPSGNTVTSTASVTTAVPPSPIAVNITTIALTGQPVTIPVVKDGNPGNSTFDPTSIQIITQPQHGTLTINPDGTITYTPNVGYTGPDSFSYRLKDANGYFTNVATVSITDVDKVNLKIPNLFTPNGDGVNDFFEIRGLSNYPNNELIIVNRWGNEVFRQTNYQNKWDGTGLNEGTYYFLLYIKKTDGSIFQVLKGYTTLLRSNKK
ncbi:MAG: CshA/CshB family fibrillar adhesin-related protein [Mucilaginibacter sp.]